jgi:ligand-binding SRPBCC domain-containing protein
VCDARLRHQNEDVTLFQNEQLFRAELWLPHPRDVVFPFFADARNLEAITPPFLKFTVLTPPPIEMRVGALIDYKLRLRGFPIRWRTRITAWEPPLRFVDEQIRGPYSQWIHEHSFEERDGGTLMRDVVRYIAPGGAIVHFLFVRRDVESIFAFRRRRIAELLGEPV